MVVQYFILPHQITRSPLAIEFAWPKMQILRELHVRLPYITRKWDEILYKNKYSITYLLHTVVVSRALLY